MQQLTTPAELTAALAEARATGQRIGFVPTMGALHRGHLALVSSAMAENDVTVVSIFVNPTQFNEPADLEAYPRTPADDARLLEQQGCDIVFMPRIEDVYPEGTEVNAAAEIDYAGITGRLEGAGRPGHFDGVAQVVSRLLAIVQPTTLYLGQKDYQQIAVVRRMAAVLFPGVDIQTVPTVRDPDGLALSSRNVRLSPDERRAAGSINRHLSAVVGGIQAAWPARRLEELALAQLAKHPLLEPEYLEIVDGTTLQPYEDGAPSQEIVVLTAVRVGPVRLIDNRIAYRANP